MENRISVELSDRLNGLIESKDGGSFRDQLMVPRSVRLGIRVRRQGVVGNARSGVRGATSLLFLFCESSLHRLMDWAIPGQIRF